MAIYSRHPDEFGGGSHRPLFRRLSPHSGDSPKEEAVGPPDTDRCDRLSRTQPARRAPWPHQPTRGAPRGLRLFGALLALLALVGVTAGCDSPAPDEHTVVLLVTGTQNEPAPDLGPSDLAALTAAAEQKGETRAVVVSLQDQPVTLDLTPHRSNGQVEHGPRREAIIQTNVEAVRQAVSQQAATGPFDLAEGLSAASRLSEGPATLIVVSSAASTAGAFNLTALGWGADPEASAEQMVQAKALATLSGWTVVFSGVGQVHQPQPALPNAQRETLASYVMAMCQATGAASCSVNDEPRQQGEPTSTVPVPVIPIPAVTSVKGPNGTQTTALPSETLFAYGSADLLGEAQQVLAPLAAAAVAGDLSLEVTGYASPDGGSAQFNRDLSLRRAQAVAAALQQLGVAPGRITSVQGRGFDDFPAEAALGSDGQPDPTKLAQMRRVDVLATPPGAARG